MGHDLYREIMRGWRPGWDTGMLAVALAIADDASDKTRRTVGYQIAGYWRPHGKGWRDGISEHTGLNPDGVGKALRRLAAAGYEMRVQVGKDRRGRPVYAYRGHATDYQVPPLPAREPPAEPERSACGPPIEPERSAHRPLKVGPQADPSPHVPSEDLSPQDIRSSTAAAAEADSDIQDPNTHQERKIAETVVAACLSYRLLGMEPDGRTAGYLQRTLHSDLHRGLVSFTRSAARHFGAAPDAWLELATMAADGNLVGESEDLLSDARAAARAHVLTEAAMRWCDKLARVAQAEAEDLYLAARAEPVTLAQAAEAGYALALTMAPVKGGRVR